MQKLLHYLPFAIALALCVCAVFVTWKLARRWNAELRSAQSYRAHLEGEANAAAALRAQMSQVVNANPQIFIGTGLQSEVRDTGRISESPGDNGTLCPLCARPHCWFDCVKKVGQRGPADELLAGRVAELSAARIDRALAGAVRDVPRYSAADFDQLVDYQEELEEGDVGP